MKGSSLLWMRGKGQMRGVPFCCEYKVSGGKGNMRAEVMCVARARVCVCAWVIDEVYSCGLSPQILWSNRQSISAYWTRGFLCSPPYCALYSSYNNNKYVDMCEYSRRLH